MDGSRLERAGRYIISRRVALGYQKRVHLANDLDISDRTLADIEHGVRESSPQTYAQIENLLKWKPGSINTMLEGGEPAEIGPRDDEVDLSRVPAQKLVEELHKRFPPPDVDPRIKRDAPPV